MTATSESLEVTSSGCSAPAPNTGECCSLSQGVIGADDAQRIAGVLKALADPMRLRLLSHLAAQGCDSVCSCDFTEELGIRQPTVSHHMKKLVDAGLISREQRGKWAHYSVIPAAFAEVRRLLDLR